MKPRAIVFLATFISCAPAAAGPRWDGPYIGAHGGHASADVSARAAGAGAGSAGLDGGVYGGLAGYALRRGSVVFGAEADIGGAGLAHTVAVPGLASRSEIDVLATLRARAGIASGRWLIYGTAGAAFMHGESTLTGPGLRLRDSNWHAGWAAGGGVEIMAGPRVSLKGEYLRLGLGEESYHPVIPGGLRADADIDVFRAGVHLRLGGRRN